MTNNLIYMKTEMDRIFMNYSQKKQLKANFQNISRTIKLDFNYMSKITGHIITWTLQQMQKQRNRVVYTSLDVKRPSTQLQSKQKQRTRKKKQKRVALNAHLSNAARVYLREPKLLTGEQISSLLKNHIHGTNEASFLFKRLEGQIKRRQSQEGEIKIRVNRNKNKKSERYISQRKSSQNNSELQSRYRFRYGLDDHRTDRNISYSEHPQYQNQFTNNISSRQVLKINSQRKEEMKLERIEQSYKRSRKRGTNNSLVDAKKIYLNHQLFQSQKKRDKLNPINSLERQLVQSSPKISDHSIQTIQNKPRLTIRNIKGFVINEKDEQVSKVLLDQGWKQFGQHSEKYTLKWTYNDSFKDYQLLRSANKTNMSMYFNHVCSNKLINKDDFCKIAQSLRHKGVNTSAFIPETFILSNQYLQFVYSYEVRSIFAGLQKHHNYFKLKHEKNGQLFTLPQQPMDVNSQIRNFVNFLLSINEQSQQVENLLRKQVQNEEFLVNITLLYNILVLCANFWICQQGQQSELFDSKFRHLCADRDVISKLIALNKADLLFQQYNQFKCTIKKRKQSKQKRRQLSLVNGYLKTVRTFMTPSQNIIHGVYLFHQYFNSFVLKKIPGGLRNLWIVKPCTGSKGCGIQIIDRIEKITPFSQSNSNKIAQKYIQNIWTVKNECVVQHNLNLQSVKMLINRKFDIRQWVLLKPPCSYIFSSFYLRICSKQYGFQSLNDHLSHLSNFTINKDNFNKLEESVMSEKEFKNILQTIGQIKQYNELKKKIKERIKLLVNQALTQCQVISGTFEIIGFDILIDQQFNPWIIECNMSPACNLRTDWLKQMKYQMTTGALKIVLEKDLYTGDQNKPKSEYEWEILSKVKNLGQKDQFSQLLLQVNGERMKINKSVTRDYEKRLIQLL